MSRPGGRRSGDGDGGGGEGGGGERLQVMGAPPRREPLVLRLVRAGELAAVALDAARNVAVARAYAERAVERLEAAALQQLHSTRGTVQFLNTAQRCSCTEPHARRIAERKTAGMATFARK